MSLEPAVLDCFSGWDLCEPERYYLRFHSRRLAYALEVVEGCLARVEPDGTEPAILDIGPHFLTEMLRWRFSGVAINTLGFRNPRCYREEHIRAHLQFDLNEAQYSDRWPAFAQHDVVVLSEVLEHLYTAPQLVLAFVKQLMKPGGFLVVQTPNAVSLEKRLAMLRGCNPFEMIRTTRENPGHFREYTLHELRALGGQAGLAVDRWDLQNYFNGPRGYVGVLGRLKRSFRQGITIVYRKPKMAA